MVIDELRRPYSYCGPVWMFDKLVCPSWSSETLAVSEKQARSNLTHQYKQQHGLSPRSKITLTGEIKAQ